MKLTFSLTVLFAMIALSEIVQSAPAFRYFDAPISSISGFQDGNFRQATEIISYGSVSNNFTLGTRQKSAELISGQQGSMEPLSQDTLISGEYTSGVYNSGITSSAAFEDDIVTTFGVSDVPTESNAAGEFTIGNGGPNIKIL